MLGLTVGKHLLYTSSLFDEESTITGVGQVYAAINLNTMIGPGQDTEFTPCGCG
jgi:hypothetical protein